MADIRITSLALLTSVDPSVDALMIEDISSGETKKTTANALKTAMSLSNVDNTSDLNKPISTATQTALDGKQGSLTLTTTGTSGAATLVGDTLNIPQYSGGGSAGVSSLEGLTGALNLAAGSGISISDNGSNTITITNTGGGGGGGVTSVDISTSTSGVTVGGGPVTSTGTLTVNVATANSGANGLLSSTDWSTFNSKEPAISTGTTSQYYRGDKTFQTLDKAAVGLSNVDNTSDANKPVSTATQTALDGKIAKSVGATYTTNSILTLTQAEYDAIGTKDPNTLYFII